MALARKILLRLVFVLLIVLVLVGDYTGLLTKLLSGTRAETEATTAPRTHRPTNPGYGDPKTEIDLDADIEDESIKSLGKIKAARLVSRLP